MSRKITQEWILSGARGHLVKDRLMSKAVKNVDTGCMEMQSGLDRCGYGRFKINGRSLGAHKISYILHHGDYDQDNLEIMHSCDNPKCINPDHLSVGSHSENIIDCILKGRHSTASINCDVNISGLIMYFSSRKLALFSSEKYYYGSECKKHGNVARITSSGECCKCRAEYNNKRRITNSRVAGCPLVVSVA